VHEPSISRKTGEEVPWPGHPPASASLHRTMPPCSATPGRCRPKC